MPQSTLVYETGEAVLEELRAFAVAWDLKAGHFTGLGAFSEATLAF